MRTVVRLLPLLALAGCAAAAGPVAVASVAAIATVQRDPADVVVSAVTGRDCSVVRLSVGQSYCKPVPPPPPQPEYCTHSLGTVDCWDHPDPFGYYQREVADGPTQLTPEQEAHRTARWPNN